MRHDELGDEVDVEVAVLGGALLATDLLEEIGLGRLALLRNGFTRVSNKVINI